MPRSYSFDHYLAPKTGTPKPPRGVRGKHGKKGKQNAGELHYGKQHAQTEELYAAHQMEHELEELAGVAEQSPRMSRSAEDRKGSERRLEDPMERLRKEQPIGAIPYAEEPGTAERSKLRDVWDDGMRHVKLIGDGVRDVRMAAGRLLRLPGDFVRVVFRRPRHA